MKRNANRNRVSGQYAHDMNVVCQCGRTKGQHLAEAPYPYESDSEEKECTGFKKAK